MFEPGVAIGDGKDVQRVDLVDGGLEAGGRGAEGAEEAGAVAGSTGHQRRRRRTATSVPLSARSDGPSPVGGPRRGGLPPDGPRPATRIDSWSTSRPSAVGSRGAPPSRPAGPPRRSAALGDTEVQPDRRVPPPATDTRSPPGRRSISRTTTGRPAARESGDAVRAERHAADDVDDGPSSHERPAGDGDPATPLVRWATAAPVGNRRDAWYSTAPFGPDRPRAPSLIHLRGSRWPVPARSAARCRWAATTRSRRA